VTDHEQAHQHRHDEDHSDRWQRFDAAFWDEHYGSAPALWSGRPNPVLLDEVTDLPPGRALDVGCGEGADALWLAGRGWHVLATDVSQVALDRAAAAVDAGGLSDQVMWVQHDLSVWTPPARSFDLVSSQFFHLPADIRPRIYAGLAGSVAPGGTFLVVAHHPSDLDTTMQRPPVEEMFFTADELADQLDDEWEVQLAEARPRKAIDPDGREITITDTVLKARRRSD
jgi:SAM-dependent methyltransferase